VTALFRVHPALALLLAGVLLGYALAKRPCAPQTPDAAAMPADTENGEDAHEGKTVTFPQEVKREKVG
jgi:hypothetical protein